jgi:hypothetical protein
MFSAIAISAVIVIIVGRDDEQAPEGSSGIDGLL